MKHPAEANLAADEADAWGERFALLALERKATLDGSLSPDDCVATDETAENSFAIREPLATGAKSGRGARHSRVSRASPGAASGLALLRSTHPGLFDGPDSPSVLSVGAGNSFFPEHRLQLAEAVAALLQPKLYVTIGGEEYCMPEQFGIVEHGLYRCAFPTSEMYAFLRRLRVRTVVNLLDKFPLEYESFVLTEGIQYYHAAVKGNKLHAEEMDRDVVKQALAVIMDSRSHPLVVHCRSGKHRTGALIGCVRMLQGWRLEDACAEYVTYCQHKQRDVDKQYIERFDPRTLASVAPPDFVRASWLPPDCCSRPPYVVQNKAAAAVAVSGDSDSNNSGAFSHMSAPDMPFAGSQHQLHVLPRTPPAASARLQQRSYFAEQHDSSGAHSQAQGTPESQHSSPMHTATTVDDAATAYIHTRPSSFAPSEHPSSVSTSTLGGDAMSFRGAPNTPSSAATVAAAATKASWEVPTTSTSSAAVAVTAAAAASWDANGIPDTHASSSSTITDVVVAPAADGNGGNIADGTGTSSRFSASCSSTPEANISIADNGIARSSQSTFQSNACRVYAAPGPPPPVTEIGQRLYLQPELEQQPHPPLSTADDIDHQPGALGITLDIGCSQPASLNIRTGILYDAGSERLVPPDDSNRSVQPLPFSHAGITERACTSPQRIIAAAAATQSLRHSGDTPREVDVLPRSIRMVLSGHAVPVEAVRIGGTVVGVTRFSKASAAIPANMYLFQRALTLSRGCSVDAAAAEESATEITAVVASSSVRPSALSAASATDSVAAAGDADAAAAAVAGVRFAAAGSSQGPETTFSGRGPQASSPTKTATRSRTGSSSSARPTILRDSSGLHVFSQLSEEAATEN